MVEPYVGPSMKPSCQTKSSWENSRNVWENSRNVLISKLLKLEIRIKYSFFHGFKNVFLRFASSQRAPFFSGQQVYKGSIQNNKYIIAQYFHDYTKVMELREYVIFEAPKIKS
jgi:hypothetical protein